ncbi:DUF3391 domain-containing protein [Propionivibrio sp.]|uniref:DUF3391 domain-containing protein n=1 Tax=Propionivibrio sp. TaxID=2212460 RepID=UPI0025F253BF|nr:DUF3391 domain-containing protein [Propionivibrio sp.]
MIKTMPAAKKMPDPKDQFIDVADLRVGLFVFIDLGWMSHPFPLNSFKIHSPEQIATIRTLGIERIRYSPEKSDPEPVAVEEIEGTARACFASGGGTGTTPVVAGRAKCQPESLRASIFASRQELQAVAGAGEGPA